MPRSSLDCRSRGISRALPDLFVPIIPQERTGCNSPCSPGENVPYSIERKMIAAILGRFSQQYPQVIDQLGRSEDLIQ